MMRYFESKTKKVVEKYSFMYFVYQLNSYRTWCPSTWFSISIPISSFGVRLISGRKSFWNFWKINFFDIKKIFWKYLRSCSIRNNPNVNPINGYAKHRRKRQEPSENMTPHRKVVVVGGHSHGLVFDQSEYHCSLEKNNITKLEWKVGFYHANYRSRKNPTKFPPSSRIIADHRLHMIVPSIDANTPRDRNTLEK